MFQVVDKIHRGMLVGKGTRQQSNGQLCQTDHLSTYHGHTETCAQGYNDMNLEIFSKCGDVKE